MNIETILHFADIHEHHRFYGLTEPDNQFFSIVTYIPPEKKSDHNLSHNFKKMSSDFYIISLRDIIPGAIECGKTKYDCNSGSMLFTAPGQVITINETILSIKSTYICFHKDYIKGHALREKINNYNYFSYTINESLHLSQCESKIMQSIIESITMETCQIVDEFSKGIILSHIDAMLIYANRFYKRQFLNRKEISEELIDKFKDVLTNYFESGQFNELGLPKIETIAKELAVSSRYLSDSLKIETGKTTMEHIHLFLIDEAKNMLHDSSNTITQIAYNLGFDYPQYFSRLFKKKVGLSPSEYRESLTSFHLQ